jgi:CRP/FNR family cyclic AMP-dependent transcriptional regulator
VTAMSAIVLAELLSLPVGEELRREHLERLAAIGARETYGQDVELFHEGQPTDALRIVVEGRIALELAVPGRAPKILASLSRGDLLGWSALSGRRSGKATWTATARAVKPSVCLAFPGAALRRLCEQDHELGYHVMVHAFEVVAQRLTDTRVGLLDLYGGGA